jgi:hypothetical protein
MRNKMKIQVLVDYPQVYVVCIDRFDNFGKEIDVTEEEYGRINRVMAEYNSMQQFLNDKWAKTKSEVVFK